MLGAAAVKHMAMEPNISPPTKDKGIANRNRGVRIRGLKVKLTAPITASTMVALIVALVAPHSSSPATTSSTLIGVATIASKVFWKYMRTNEAKVHSKKAPFIIAIAIKAGEINTRYG